MRALRHGALAALLALVALPPAARAEGTTLSVKIAGVTNAEGTLLVQLANSQEDYDSDDSGFRFKREKATGKDTVVQFEDLPEGDYALKIFHDANDNEKIDIGWMGPEEAFGFSNDARALMGPPDWSEAKFAVSGESQSVVVHIK